MEEEKIKLKTPFKSQSDLVIYVKGLAKKSVEGLRLLGIPENAEVIYLWQELMETRVDDVLEEKQRRLDELMESLSDMVDEVRSAAIDVEAESQRLEGVTSKALRLANSIKAVRSS